MVDITLDLKTMQYMRLFENVTKTKVVDCVNSPRRIVFLVPNGKLGKAIGKDGSHAKKLRNILKKNLEIIEMSEELETFVMNIFHKFKVKAINPQDGPQGITVYVQVDPGQKGRAIGKDGENLKFYTDIVKRHFENVNDIYIN